MTWRRARRYERCGFCVDHVFTGPTKTSPGEPVFLYGASGLVRCAACAKERYGQDVPVPFPEAEVSAVIALSLPRRPDFVTPRSLVPTAAADFKARQIAIEREPGEDDG